MRVSDKRAAGGGNRLCCVMLPLLLDVAWRVAMADC